MTRKDFKAIADALKATRPDQVLHPGRHETWEATVNRVASEIRELHNNFDQARFFNYIYGE